MALDTLSIPTMSMECERVFSSAKKLLIPARDNLQEDIIEATEYLKVWWDEEIIQRRGEGASEIYSKQFLFRQSRYL
jgi:hypothetical protein